MRHNFAILIIVIWSETYNLCIIYEYFSPLQIMEFAAPVYVIGDVLVGH